MPTLTTDVSRLLLGLAAATLFSAVAIQAGQAQSAATSFFVTSNGIGNGANLGGLAGADNHCQTLAQAAGVGGKSWRAYLSTQAADGQPAVNARDRVGNGPWQNSKGVVIAKDVAELHGANNLTKQTALSEKDEELGVAQNAPPEEIKDSFRALVRILHPDHQTDPQLKEIAERQMRKLNGIYAVLSEK